MRTITKPKIPFYLSPLVIFSLLMFFVSFGDSIMSYFIPVVIEEYSSSTIFMGLIISFSSLSGLFLDFFISEKFWNKNYIFFTKLTLITTLLFPLVLLIFKPSIPTFLLGMFMWGCYYEYRGFSMFSFVNSYLDKDHYTKGWAILNGYKALAYLLGAILSGYLINYGATVGFTTAILAFAPAIIIYIVATKIKKSFVKFGHRHLVEPRRNIREEFRILRVLIHKIWPIFLFSFMIFFVDACFWTIGVLLSVDIKQTDQLGSLLLVAYLLPPIFSRYITDIFNLHIGKKRTAFLYGLLASVFLVAIGTTQSVIPLLIYVFIMSIFVNVAFILQSAVMEDYMTRLQQSGHGNDIVTLEQMSGSLAYIISPIVLGVLAYFIGYTQTFAVTGILFGVISFICFVWVPLKIKMPQKALRNIEA